MDEVFQTEQCLLLWNKALSVLLGFELKEKLGKQIIFGEMHQDLTVPGLQPGKLEMGMFQPLVKYAVSLVKRSLPKSLGFTPVLLTQKYSIYRKKCFHSDVYNLVIFLDYYF